MKRELPYYRQKIIDNFYHIKNKKGSFSLRAYARYLKILPPTLSGIINGKRNLPLKHVQFIAEKLELSPAESERFMRSILESKAIKKPVTKNDPKKNWKLLKDEAYYHVIAEWEHYAILSLMDLKDFKSTTRWISNKLGLSELRVMTCLSRLVETGLIKEKNGKYIKCVNGVYTSEDVESFALRKSHKESLSIAADKLESTPIDKRDFSSITLSVDMNKLQEAKNIIRKFRIDMMKLVENNNASEVYQLAVQFFPFSALDNKISKEECNEVTN